MSQNAAIALIVIVIVAAGAGAYIYHEQHKNSVEISIGDKGVKIQGPSN
ncbi:hypothetical protein [Labrys monachus]|uniref:Uncharacterized protein n=1 Tax=Labrys monachus TaxID=217067 RepID=A0ABU0FH52_9HYPH|nr:hypothetical protein [Labrys monachus]MDQ0393934.1 hypothetical protein [Labrys monachus]